MVVIDDETKANITSAGTSIWNWISNTLAAGQTNDHHFGSKLEGDEVEKLTHEATHVASKINSKLNSWGLPSLPSFGPLLGLSYIAPANHVVFHSSPWWALFGSLSLSATYVGSLYVWPYLSRKFG